MVKRACIICACLFTMACAHIQPEYEICNTDNCGDNIPVEVE